MIIYRIIRTKTVVGFLIPVITEFVVQLRSSLEL